VKLFVQLIYMKTSRYTELLWYLIQFLRRGVFALSDTGVGQKWNFSYSYFIWQPVDKLNFFDTSYSFFRREVFALSDSAPDASFCLCCVLLLLLLLPEVKERIKFWHHSWTVIYFSRCTTKQQQQAAINRTARRRGHPALASESKWSVESWAGNSTHQ
jgi:hypothetical protein